MKAKLLTRVDDIPNHLDAGTIVSVKSIIEMGWIIAVADFGQRKKEIYLSPGDYELIPMYN